MLSKFGSSIRSGQAKSRPSMPVVRPHTPVVPDARPPATLRPTDDARLSPSPTPTPDYMKRFLVWWKPVLAEFTSTALLILLGCMLCVALPNQNDSPTYVPLGFGFIMLLNVQIFGRISGAYMNPAVSVSAVLCGCVPLPVGACYVAAQCLGAVVGYGLLVVISPIDVAANAVCVTEPTDSLEVYQSVLIETVLTMVMNLLNCGLWDPANKERQESMAVKVGLAVAGLSLAGGPLTGASMNPARSLAPAIWTRRWRQHWLYWIGPLVGGVLPVYIYKYLIMKKANNDEFNQFNTFAFRLAD